MQTTLDRTMISRPVVAGLAIDLQQVPENFIGERIATPFQVDSEDFTYPVFGNEGLEASDDDLRGLDAEFKEVRIAEGMNSATIDEHGLKARLDRRRIRAARRIDRNAGSTGASSSENRLKARTAAMLRMKILRRKEIIIASLATSPGNYTGTHKSNTINVATDAAIRTKVDALRLAIAGDTGYEPNTMVFGRTARYQAGENPAIIDAMPSDAPKLPTNEFLSLFFDIPNVLPGTALFKKTKNAVAKPIWDDVIWLGYVDPTANSESQTWARNFWMPWENGLAADVNEIEVGNERFVMMSYAEMYRPTIVGANSAALIYDTNQDGL